MRAYAVVDIDCGDPDAGSGKLPDAEVKERGAVRPAAEPDDETADGLRKNFMNGGGKSRSDLFRLLLWIWGSLHGAFLLGSLKDAELHEAVVALRCELIWGELPQLLEIT